MTFLRTDAQPVQPPADPNDGVVCFGAAEVAYAISLSEGIQKRKAISFLQVDDAFLTDQIIALGASSLLARGQLSIEGDVMRPRGGLRLLAAALRTAMRWTEIALVNEDGTTAAVYVSAPDLSIFLQPAAMSTWELVVKAPLVSDADMLMQMIESNAVRHPVGVTYFGTETATSPKNHLFVRASEDGTWGVADVENVDDRRHVDGVSTEVLRERLVEFAELPAL
ncbi:hypothetical protein [Agreia sp. VKM Ac-1783]|uniref:hypothetical protein n=1 Tax=Agreia sp. VKM Ac-1783 TaxID=1938889 RepID=UPI000A2AA972|nr:hypothetical protein [Agreia sp. VKM Ac-1783]SMQ68016.1 hypothetical protein SAMN06295943_1448 [Agreia sp. VKM Ac-1783]